MANSSCINVDSMCDECNATPIHRTDDVRIDREEELCPPKEVLSDLLVPPSVSELVFHTRRDIRRILEGTDKRLLIIVGPCSVHNCEAALGYAHWLGSVRNDFSHDLLIVMRVYFEKPRTLIGWKGFINDPDLDGSFRINDGVRLARKLLIDINQMGIPTATEFVDPITSQFLSDLISWAAIGARTSESPVHRELASGLSCPVGFKNNTAGNTEVAANAVLAARQPQHFLSVTKSGAAAIITTRGNPDCHVILRGGPQPNYDRASVKTAAALLESRGLLGRVMIDCSHGNCQREYRRQLDVARDVCSQLGDGSRQILGVMIESNLIEGRQDRIQQEQLLPGQSITDPCIGIGDTSYILSVLAEETHATAFSSLSFGA